MNSGGKISSYLEKVCQQVSWKKSHSQISEEMEDHILEYREELILSGLDKEEATEKAIEEMGDPVLIGSELDSIYRPKIEWSVMVMAILILGLGIFIRTTMPADHFTLQHTIIYSLIALLALGIGYGVDFSLLGRYPRILYFSYLILSIIFGLYRWYWGTHWSMNIAFEYSLLIGPIFLSGIVFSLRDRGLKGILLSGLYFLLPIIIMMLGRFAVSGSYLFIYIFSYISLIIYSIRKDYFNIDRKGKWTLILACVLLVGIFLGLYLYNYKWSPYRLDYLLKKISIIFNPQLDPQGMGYVAGIIREILINSKFIGPSGIDIINLLPSIKTDYLITYLIGTYGWASFIGLLSIIGYFSYRLIRISLEQKGVLASLLSLSILVIFIGQVVFYTLNNLGLSIFQAFSLPLLSQGGTGTVINMFLIGLLLSVFKLGFLYRNDEFNKTGSYKKGSFSLDFKNLIG